MNKLADTIIQKIEDGEVTMQPRWHFVLKTVLVLTGISLIALVAIYILSFILFTLHKSGLWLAPQFGYRGIVMFIIGTPWLLIAILGIFLLALYVLVSHYSFSYRKPLVYSLIGLVLGVIIIASIIQYVGVHDRVQSFVDRHNIPGLRPLYRGPAERRPAGVERGTISEIRSSGFVLATDESETLEIIIDTTTKLPPSYNIIIGHKVIVFGDRIDDTITAFGIKPAREGQFKLPSRNSDNHTSR